MCPTQLFVTYFIPIRLKKDIPRSIIHKLLNDRYTREIVDEFKQKYHTFVGICHPFVYPYLPVWT